MGLKDHFEHGRWAWYGAGCLVALSLGMGWSACGRKSAPPEAPTAAPVTAPAPAPSVVEPDADEAPAPAPIVDDGPVAAPGVDPLIEDSDEHDTFAEDMLAQLERDFEAGADVQTTLPDDFPADVPLPSDLDIQAVMVGEVTIVQGTSSLPIQALISYYQQESYRKGWAVGEQTQMSGRLERMRGVVFEKEGRTLELTLIESSHIPNTQVTLTLREP